MTESRRVEGKGLKMVVLAVAMAVFPAVSQASIVADFAADYAGVSFPAGWEYLRNTGTIGNDANYTPLLWDAGNGFYDTTGAGFPAPGPDYSLVAGGTTLHPGMGTAQGSAFDRYVILAYTIQPGEAGTVSLVNGSIGGNDPSGANGNSNGWDIRIYAGNVQAGATVVVPWSLSDSAFSQPLGALNAGDIVYVALGPNGNHLYDSAHLSFQLDSVSDVPEPGSFGLIAAGLLAFGGWRRRVGRATRGN